MIILNVVNVFLKIKFSGHFPDEWNIRVRRVDTISIIVDLGGSSS